jgi:glutamate-ammonia-ligase adenylyltransferase
MTGTLQGKELQERLRAIAGHTAVPGAALRALEDLPEEHLGACGDLFLERLGNLLAASAPMLDSLRGHPEWIAWLRERVELEDRPGSTSRTWDVPVADRDLLDPDLLKLPVAAWKQRQYLEIAYRDVSGLDGFETTVARLSAVADAIIARVLGECWSESGESIPPNVAPPKGFAVFALGKLGAAELNYSSDIDLLFCRRTRDEKEEMRFFTRLGERLARALSGAGSLYRVDLRLRPYGEAGALVPTLDSLVTYYESWGEAWERQALIKARYVTGDEDLGRHFTDFVQRYVFSRAPDDASLEELKRVKHRSEREYARPGGKIHVKQGPGGIRDIEFYVQFHQLIAGPRHAGARAPGTLEALQGLDEARVLLEGEHSQLALAYRFMRTVEHRLQMRALAPQAVVPDARSDLEPLARALGFEGTGEEAISALRAALDSYRKRVRVILERVYLTPGYLRLREREEEFAQLLTERMPRERARALLSAYGFAQPEKAWQNIRLMAMGPGGNILPPGERRAFLEFAFPLLDVIRGSLDPDHALHKLEGFAAATGNRVSFLRALAARRPHLQRLANLLALSNLSYQILVRHPEYFDSLARGVHLHEGRTAEEMYAELAGRFGASPRGEERENVLRRFRQREMVRIAYRDLAGLGDPVEIGSELSDLAEACLRASLELTRPPRDVFAPDEAAPLHVIAMGKLGSRQVHYGSDLDLVFLYDDPPDGARSAEARAEIQLALDARIERLLEFVAGVTTEGVAYRVDLRLRPEGSSGLLARSWSSFLEYAERHMQPWERMALVRSRNLFADAAQECRWEQVLERCVYRYPWDRPALEAVRRLKRRIETELSRESRSQLDFKHGKGGGSDLEFLVQLLQVMRGGEMKSLRSPSVAEALAALGKAGVLPAAEADELREAYRFQRRLESRYQLMEEWAAREISRESPALERLARSLGYHGRSEFLAEWDAHSVFVRGMMERYFYGDL